MPSVNETIQQLQGVIGQLSNAAKEIDERQLDEALKSSHNLLFAAQEAAKVVNADNLKRFLLEMSSLLEQLRKCAPASSPTQLEHMIQPETLLERLTSAYQSYIDPMIAEAQNIAQTTARDVDILSGLGSIASLGIEVFDTCAAIVHHNKDMTPTEKVYAMAGTVLMVSGIGILVAVTVNPHIGIPTIAALTLITLGCFLCQKALKSSKNKEIHEKLYRVSEQLDNTANAFHSSNYPRNLLTFSQHHTTHTESEDNQTAPSLGTKIMQGLRNLFSGN